MKKEDRFIPVLSLVVYYGQEKWDAAKSLHELLDMKQLPPTLRQYIENYHIHVFDYHDYDNFDMFHTELKQVFSFLKHSSDKKELKKLIAEHQEEYYNVSRKTCELIAVLTNSKELIKPELYENKEAGGVNMCKALEDMKLEERQEGIKIGTFQAFHGLVKDGILKVSEAASRMHISEDDFIARMNEEEVLCEEYR